MTARLPPRRRLAGSTFATAWSVSRHIPEAVARPLVGLAADRAWKRGGPGVSRLESNLARAVPRLSPDELHQLTRQAMRSYARYWHEAVRLPWWSHARILDTVVATNEAALRTVHRRGSGAIVALPHMANWDLAGAWACLTGLPVSTVAERVQPESLYERFVAYRTQLGMEVVPLAGGDSLAAMRAALDRGRVVCLLADRTIAGGGVEVDLVGERARLPAGPATLSRLSGVPIVVATPSYDGPRMRMEISDPIEPGSGRSGALTMTQRIADLFGAAITRAPQDWHMLQPVFVADLNRGRA